MSSSAMQSCPSGQTTRSQGSSSNIPSGMAKVPSAMAAIKRAWVAKDVITEGVDGVLRNMCNTRDSQVCQDGKQKQRQVLSSLPRLGIPPVLYGGNQFDRPLPTETPFRFCACFASRPPFSCQHREGGVMRSVSGGAIQSGCRKPRWRVCQAD